MKKRTFFLLVVCFLAFSAEVFAQKVRLRGKVTPDCMVTGNANWKFADIYGDGNIAVQGTYNCRGAFIYDISDPDNPVLASWYNPGANQQFLEAIVIGNRGYFGSGNGGGVHIVDLSNPYNPQLLGVVNSSNGNGFNSIHEIVVFEQNGRTYLVENYNSISYSKLLKVIDVTNPASPVFIRDINPTEVQWVHAVHIRGNRMFTSGWGNSTTRARTEIYDISNIATRAPILLGYIEDPSPSVTNGNNMHSSWTSEDGRYLYSCREVTNSNGPSPGDVRVYNIENPAQPLLVKRISMRDLQLNAVTPHNPVVMGNLLFVSWYQAGLQVFDISNPTDPKRIAQYDTFPSTFMPSESLSLADEPWDVVCGSSNLQNTLPTNYDGNWAVYPFLGYDKVLVGDMKEGLLIVDVTGVFTSSKNIISDFDGDGKTDFSVFNPSTGIWTVEKSSNSAVETTRFGLNGDIIQATDFDGDRKSDLAVFRPSNGTWYVLGSSRGFFVAQFGANGDIPVAADYDADGKADFAVYRPSTGHWYVQQTTFGFRAVKWGVAEDKPIIGDFEGDGKADFTVWRPSSGTWYVMLSSSSLSNVLQFGINGDLPLSGDFDGDGKNDFAVFRPSNGYWFILNSQSNSLSVYKFGLSSDIPVPADYDGDERSDVAVFRPGNNFWYRLSSSNGSFNERAFGAAGEVPVPLSFQAHKIQ
ncbi:MAG: FG-GAP-like repeat-containing protein [Pyrinomonadaceae bacterium]|nr:FG-GAP-like repeat-containing protein [Pyrinomonadaceae bacterium]MCX7640609.1 FG-GAP-like repeat-containing protein [Pyrinomonadaceae bacterium]MDW8305163.1 FG-GAP-like repeat-containing protein [Acidobacteriota bacterium]